MTKKGKGKKTGHRQTALATSTLNHPEEHGTIHACAHGGRTDFPWERAYEFIHGF